MQKTILSNFFQQSQKAHEKFLQSLKEVLEMSLQVSSKSYKNLKAVFKKS